MISSSPRNLPMDSGASRCQQASARATARPCVVRYMTMGRFAIVFGSRLRPTSWSHAAAYQALSGKCRKAAWPVGDWVGPDICSSSSGAAGSGGDRILVVGGCLVDHEVEEEGDDHDSGGDVDAGRPAPGHVPQDA